MTEVVWNGYTQAEIEAQYFLRGLRPDYEVTVIPDWLADSERFRSTATCSLDITYGPTSRSKLDFFPAFDGAPFVLYIHGGYWQRGDRSIYSFLAEPFVHHGISVALMSYDMCPNVAMAAIAPQARQAVQFLWEHADDFKIPRDRFSVMGHSAGGHLTAEMMFTDWAGADSAVVLHAGVALSGIYDFEPILLCSENERLQLDEISVVEVSPLNRTPPTDAPLLVGYGELEPPDMHRQSHLLVDTFGSGRSMPLLEAPNVDHFDILNTLADDQSELFNAALDIVR